MIDPDRPTPPEPEVLHKVLPAGVPLVQGPCRLCGAEPGGQCNLQNQSRADCRLVLTP